MAIQNISKYVQINDFLLLEYEFSRDGTELTNSDVGGAYVVMTDSSVKQYYNRNILNQSLGSTNNILALGSTPTESSRSIWFTSTTDSDYDTYFNSSTTITDDFEYDTIKVHVVSGYNFDDVAGFLLQVRAEDVSANLVDLSNFAYLKQSDTRGSDVVKFSDNALYLGNRFYDKYVTFKVPSVYALGGQTGTDLTDQLLIKPLSDVYLTYGTVATIQATPSLSGTTSTFSLSDFTDFRLPVISAADNFNIFIAESTVGDFIEFYATWKDVIIGEYMGDIESGRIPLYTSNNPNDNYTEFTETYGTETAKWVIIHEIYVYENLPGAASGSSLLTQKYTFTQEDSFTLPNYFRPVLKNADIDASYTIQYTGRLSNRMDGTQIIRKASFASTDPKKYGLKFTRLTMENVIPYKVFNNIAGEKANVIQGVSDIKTKYSKVFYNITNIFMDQDNTIYPDGTGPLFLKNGDSVYKFKFEKYNEISDQQENVDLSGVYNYALIFTLDDGREMEIVPTYSKNMNTTLGELEFKIKAKATTTLLKQKDNAYGIVIKNPDGTHYTFYEGEYFRNSDKVQEEKKNQSLISRLNSEIDRLNTNFSKLAAKSRQSNIDEVIEDIGQNRTISTQAGQISSQSSEITSQARQLRSDTRKINRLSKANTNLTKKLNALTIENTELSKQNSSLLTQNDKLRNTTQTGRVVTTPERKPVIEKPVSPKYDEEFRSEDIKRDLRRERDEFDQER